MKLIKGVSIVVTLAMVLLYSVQAQAVLKDTAIVGSGGEPVANTEVTIFDDKGEEIGKGKTDEKGILAYDFPARGKYVVKWPDGSQALEVTTSFWTPKNIGIAAGSGIVAAAGIVAIGSGGGSGSHSSNTPGTDPASGDDDSGSGGGGSGSTTVPAISEIDGSYSGTATETSDPYNIGESTLSGSSISFVVSGNTIFIYSTATMSGTYDPSTGNYQGVGTNSSVRETFTGRFTKNGNIVATGTLTFEYLSGPNAGKSVTYNVIYTKN